jgi:hypothetical protein
MTAMDSMIVSPLIRPPDLSIMPDMAQPDGILICPSRRIRQTSHSKHRKGAHHMMRAEAFYGPAGAPAGSSHRII